MPIPAHAQTAPLLLVVEDDALVRDVVQASLTRAGYRVGDQRPDLILTDLFMPNCDGIELLRSGQLSRADAPVIAMSGGYAGIDMLAASQALGATATIAKPFMPSELLALVERTLRPSTAAQGRLDRRAVANAGR